MNLDDIINPTTFIAAAIILLMARELRELGVDGWRFLWELAYQIGERVLFLMRYGEVVITRQVNKRAVQREAGKEGDYGHWPGELPGL